MTTHQQFPAPHGPFVPVARPRTADIVATSMLIATHVGVFLLIAFFSLFWAMGTDACSYQNCNLDYLTYAYVLTDLVGGAVVVISSITAIVLMVRRRVAFAVPIVGGMVNIVLLAVSIGLLDNVVLS